MGIINVTPDSFSTLTPGAMPSSEDVLKQATLMVATGVDMIDIVGESIRP